MKLFSFERRWFVAIFEAILPSGASSRLPGGAASVPLGNFADELVRYAPLRQAIGFRGAALLVTLFGAALAGRLRPFWAETPEGRARILERLSHHRSYIVRELPQLMKMLGTMGYLGAPDVQRALGVTRLDATPPSWMEGQ